MKTGVERWWNDTDCGDRSRGRKTFPLLMVNIFTPNFSFSAPSLKISLHFLEHNTKVVTVNKQLISHSNQFVARDSAVGISTRYWLDGPGIESRLGRDFPRPS
jgi:homoserine dehydrogenase